MPDEIDEPSGERPPQKVNKRVLQREQTRKAILDAGRRLIASRGYDRTNVGAIAKEVGVAQGTIYYHFADKKALLITLLGDFFEGVRGVAEEWARETDASADKYHEFCQMIAQVLYDNADLARIIRNEGYHSDPEIQGLIQAAFTALVQQAAASLELGIELGSIRPLDTQVVALANVGMLKEVLFGLLDAEEPLDLDHLVRELSTLLSYGIRPR